LPAKPDLRRLHPSVWAVGLGAGGLVTCLATLATALAAVHRPSGRYAAIVLAGVRWSYPGLNSAAAVLVVLAATAAAALTLAGRAAWRQWRSYRRFVARIRPVASLDRDPRVRVIADPHPQAFCAGYVRPAVYVSRRTVEMLSEAELDAVLAHEHHHRRVRDPLRLACGRILGEALFFLPVLRSLADRCAAEAELTADRAAIGASDGRTAPLASALLAFEDRAPAGASGISPERVDALLGESVRWRAPLSGLVMSICALAGAGILVGLVSGSASVAVTFNLPVISNQPCIAMVAAVPLFSVPWVVIRWRRRGRRPGLTRGRRGSYDQAL
jgi:Peptidase family M48